MAPSVKVGNITNLKKHRNISYFLADTSNMLISPYTRNFEPLSLVRELHRDPDGFATAGESVFMVVEGGLHISREDGLRGSDLPRLARWTRIPDGSLITSRMSVLEQSVKVVFAELGPLMNFVKGLASEKKVFVGARAVANNFSSERHQDWDLLSQADFTFTLGQCIEHFFCTCFHRAVGYSVLMQACGLDSLVADGRVIETKQPELKFGPKLSTHYAKSALDLGEDDFEGAHVFNIVLDRGQHYLVDTAFLIDGQPVIFPIHFDGELRNTFTISLPDGRYRHYLMQGTVSCRYTDGSPI